VALPFPLSDLLVILPELVLSELALGILLWAAVVKRERERALAWASLASLAVTAALVPVAVHFAGGLPRAAFGGMFTLDGFGIFFKVLTLLAAAVTILFSLRFVGTSPYPGGEYYALLLLTTVGMMFMASGTHLVSIYIALELMALSQYVLAATSSRRRSRSRPRRSTSSSGRSPPASSSTGSPSSTARPARSPSPASPRRSRRHPARRS
jgi:NADH:ubiquinone oxidoreductase subunit 2 (chain N)